MIPHLSSSFRVLAPDLLNYGRSDRPENADVSIAAQVDYLLRLLDLLPVDRFHVVGHDVGGGIAQLIAVRRPERVRTLSLIDSVCYDN